MIAIVAAWIGTQIAKVSINGLVNKVVSGYSAGQSRVIREHEIDADVLKSGLEQHEKSQRAKYVQRGFWMLAFILIMPMAFKWSMLNLYDVFWCKGCMFPQEWTIAAYEPAEQAQATTAFNWVFGAGAAVGGVLAVFKK